MEEKISIFSKLLSIQNELKAPKNQYNKFGKYNYRSCEDILEAIKPLCLKYGAVLLVDDYVEQVGERFYIKAKASLIDIETEQEIYACAYARESENKKGMDSAQVTGATSSYARKYALNGLFCIDDTKDVDTQEYQEKKQTNNNQSKNINDYEQVGIEQATLLGEIDKRVEELFNLGVDVKSEGALHFIEKFNNNKSDVNTMTQAERYNYKKVLEKMIEIKLKENKQ
jgi:hypothetical protein